MYIKIMKKTFGYHSVFSYLCRIVWFAPNGASDDSLYEKDVFKRLTCWNRNFAKVKTMTGRATKRLRSTSYREVTGVQSIGAAFRYTCWRGPVVAYPDG
jgi:hypothetical protein